MRIGLVGILLAAAAWSQEKSQEIELDALGRTTPKSSLLGFLRSTHVGNFKQAIRYLQFSPDVAEKKKVEVARELAFVFDRGFVGNLDTVSAKPEGSLNEDLPTDRDGVGALIGSEQSSAVEMVRVTEDGRQVWLVSRETVAMAPVLFPEFGFPLVERWLPAALIETHLLSMPIWVLLAIVVSLPLFIWFAWGLCIAVIRLLPSSWALGRQPKFSVVFFIGLILHNFVSRWLGLPLVYRVWYFRMLVILSVAAWVWAIFTAIGHLEGRIRAHLIRTQNVSSQSVVQLGRRVVQILVVIGAIIVALSSFGFDITAALAGLGIGGIAVALAAQKTLENVFGGVSILTDQSIRVGDSYQIGTTVATVEDVGMRATRFRTVQRSVLYIPNAQLAAMNIENLGGRDDILFRHRICLKYGLNPEVLESLLRSLGSLLEDERISEAGRRVRLVKFGVYAQEVEVFARVRTTDPEEFLAIQEELLISILRVVVENKAELAFIAPPAPGE